MPLLPRIVGIAGQGIRRIGPGAVRPVILSLPPADEALLHVEAVLRLQGGIWPKNGKGGDRQTCCPDNRMFYVHRVLVSLPTFPEPEMERPPCLGGN